MTLTVKEIKELKAKGELKKFSWRKDYGDGTETDDTVLWVNGKPTTCLISGLSNRCRCAYMDNKHVGFYFDTNKEVKELIIKKLGL